MSRIDYRLNLADARFGISLTVDGVRGRWRGHGPERTETQRQRSSARCIGRRRPNKSCAHMSGIERCHSQVDPTREHKSSSSRLAAVEGVRYSDRGVRGEARRGKLKGEARGPSQHRLHFESRQMAFALEKSVGFCGASLYVRLKGAARPVEGRPAAGATRLGPPRPQAL
jgi:hypothetical protein